MQQKKSCFTPTRMYLGRDPREDRLWRGRTRLALLGRRALLPDLAVVGDEVFPFDT